MTLRFVMGASINTNGLQECGTSLAFALSKALVRFLQGWVPVVETQDLQHQVPAAPGNAASVASGTVHLAVPKSSQTSLASFSLSQSHSHSIRNS